MTTLDSLNQTCQNIRQATLAGEKWLADNEAEVGSQEALRKSLRRSARLLNTYAQAAGTKAGVAVFGPSQAGKSTLISSLAKGPSGSLKVDFGQSVLDYMLQINPEGGNETTGLVTRFSLDRSIEPPDPLMPVCLKLFTEIDIIKILANTFFAEARGAVKMEPETFKKILDGLAQKPPASSHLTLDDMEDLAEYVKKISTDYSSGELLEGHFWPRAIGLGQRLGLEDRATLFGLLWGNLTEFTLLYKKLYSSLERLGHDEIAFCGLNALHEPELGDQSRKNSVLHVDRLLGLLDDVDDQVMVVGLGGKKASLARPVLSALIAEIHVKVVEKPGDFMDYADILDFPGYRARSKLTDIANDIKAPDVLKTCFLRGKVAYLFERYCARNEITAMLLCVAESVQNNPDLPIVIDNWVKIAHGESAEERFGKPVCLFMVLTKFDRMLEVGAGSTDTITRWDNRYNASFVHFFGNFEWAKAWGRQGKNEFPFNNIFWLMNLDYADAFFNIDRDEATRITRSLGLRADQANWVDKVRQGYLAAESTKTHVNDPEAAWRAIVEGSDGGASYIIEKLTPILATELKLNQLTHLTLTESRLVEGNLKNFYQGGDKDEERKIKENQFKKIAAYLNNLQLKLAKFGLFLRSLMMSDADCHLIFSQSFSENEYKDEEPAEPQPMPEVDLESFLLESLAPDSPSASLSPPTRVTDFAGLYRRRLENAWQSLLGELLSDAQFLRRFSFPRDIFQQFIAELLQGAKRLKVLDTIETELRQALSYTNVNPERLLWKQGRLAATYLSEFVNFLGLPPSRLSDKERTVSVLGQEMLLFAIPEVPDDYPILPDIQSNYDLPFFKDWLRALYRLMIHNVDFAEKSYNIEENSRLGQIIHANSAARADLGVEQG
ncbi:MAG: putative virulence factor [Deltaproteobacteria bacterium]|jgi:hypothetical protein|nr:putative virulence factor [Deltaproteobacteria bacterium]